MARELELTLNNTVQGTGYTLEELRIWLSPGGSEVKNLPANVGDTGFIPVSGDSLEKEMATHSSILAWRIPWTEEPAWL